jgi:hypothetical protein
MKRLAGRQSIAGLGALIVCSQIASIVGAATVSAHPLPAAFLTARPETLLLALRAATNDAPVLIAAGVRIALGTTLGYLIACRAATSAVSLTKRRRTLAQVLLAVVPVPASGGLAGWTRMSSRSFVLTLGLGIAARLALAHELVRQGALNNTTVVETLEVLQWTPLIALVLHLFRSSVKRIKQRKREGLLRTET